MSVKAPPQLEAHVLQIEDPKGDIPVVWTELAGYDAADCVTYIEALPVLAKIQELQQENERLKGLSVRVLQKKNERHQLVLSSLKASFEEIKHQNSDYRGELNPEWIDEMCSDAIKEIEDSLRSQLQEGK